MYISGKITDENLKPIPFANVEVIGENKFAQATSSGNFNISVASENSILKFSHVNYDFYTIPVFSFKETGSVAVLFDASNPIEGIVVTNDYENPSNVLAWIFVITASVALITLMTKSNQPVKVKA
jgi:hypothetical protein